MVLGPPERETTQPGDVVRAVPLAEHELHPQDLRQGQRVGFGGSANTMIKRSNLLPTPSLIDARRLLSWQLVSSLSRALSPRPEQPLLLLSRRVPLRIQRRRALLYPRSC